MFIQQILLLQKRRRRRRQRQYGNADNDDSDDNLLDFTATKTEKEERKTTTCTTRKQYKYMHSGRVCHQRITPVDNSSQGFQQGYTPSFLLSLAKSWSWRGVAHRCQTHPHEVEDARDENGDNLLHWCAFGKAPIEVVSKILELNPGLAREENISDGNLPLHVACTYRAGGRVIKALLETYPESAGIPNRHGTYAIHLLCDYGCDLETFRTLLSIEYVIPTLQQHCKVYNCRPITLLSKQINIHENQSKMNDIRHHRHNQLQFDRFDSDELPQEFDITLFIENLRNQIHWQKSCMLLLLEYSQQLLPRTNYSISDLPIVNACITNSSCPLSILEKAIYLYPEQLMQCNFHGDTPLHIAASTFPLLSISFEEDRTRSAKKHTKDRYEWKSNLDREGILIDIVRLCPKAASVRNNNGQLPIQCLITSSLTQKWCDALQTLIHAYPESLHEIVPKINLQIQVWSNFILSPPNSMVKARSVSLPSPPSPHDAIYRILMAKPELF